MAGGNSRAERLGGHSRQFSHALRRPPCANDKQIKWSAQKRSALGVAGIASASRHNFRLPADRPSLRVIWRKIDNSEGAAVRSDGYLKSTPGTGDMLNWEIAEQ